MAPTRKFKVEIYYSGFCSYEIEAANESEAVLKAREIELKEEDLLSNLENWEEADIAEEI